jgi:hypothetical protein
LSFYADLTLLHDFLHRWDGSGVEVIPMVQKIRHQVLRLPSQA